MDKKILCRPFDKSDVKSRQGRGGMRLSYVPTHAVIFRLNEGCEKWDFEIISHEIHGDEIVVKGKLTADGVVKMAFGGDTIKKDSKGKVISLADDLKSAASDCLKKCATLLGVALELYGELPNPYEAEAMQETAPAKSNGNGNGNSAAIVSAFAALKSKLEKASTVQELNKVAGEIASAKLLADETESLRAVFALARARINGGI